MPGRVEQDAEPLRTHPATRSAGSYSPRAWRAAELSYPLAARLLAIYTRRRDLILDTGHDPVFAVAATDLGRRYQTLPASTDPAPADGDSGAETPRGQMVIVTVPALSADAEHAGDAVVRWWAELIRPAARHLADGGCLLLAAPIPHTSRRPSGRVAFAAATQAAIEAGLEPLHGILAVHDDTDDMPDRFIYYPDRMDGVLDGSLHLELSPTARPVSVLIAVRGTSLEQPSTPQSPNREPTPHPAQHPPASKSQRLARYDLLPRPHIVSCASWSRRWTLSSEDHHDPSSSRSWQISRAQTLIAPTGGAIVQEYFDVGLSRLRPWSRRPEASRLLAALKDPDRGFDAPDPRSRSHGRPRSDRRTVPRGPAALRVPPGRCRPSPQPCQGQAQATRSPSRRRFWKRRRRPPHLHRIPRRPDHQRHRAATDS
ncbi:MAG TPA: hypothetical protein VGN37_08345 [Actinocatenispora sp.]